MKANFSSGMVRFSVLDAEKGPNFLKYSWIFAVLIAISVDSFFRKVGI